MLTRRHIRVKVMQCIYALVQSSDESLEKQEKFLKYSIESTYMLYLLMLNLLVALHELAGKHVAHAEKKFLSGREDEFPNPKRFIENALLQQIVANDALCKAFKKRKLDNWQLNDEYVKAIFKEMVGSNLYDAYMSKEKSDFKSDQNFLVALYKEIIAPNEMIYDHFEDERLTWVDDIPIINTFLMKRLKKAAPTDREGYFVARLLKDEQDMVFANDLLTKTLLKNAELEKEIGAKTPNWDNDRIAEVDSILMKMAICELLEFPSIPEKVTLNEYLEIAKEYSTPKSSIFINGILDKLVKEYKTSGKMKKMGRGLL